jgi:hypothetical protein
VLFDDLVRNINAFHQKALKDQVNVEHWDNSVTFVISVVN